MSAKQSPEGDTAPAWPASEQLYARARRITPGGVQSNARFRRPHPLYFVRAKGAHLWDADGNRYLDCTMGNGAVVLGHGHPAVNDAVRRVLYDGPPTGQETETAVAAAEALAAIVPGAEAVRFATTGTEALMHALQLARHVTGRERVAKAEGAYHGWADPFWVSTWPTLEQAGPENRPSSPPGSSGLSRHATETLVLPFNDLAATEQLLREHAAELALVALEPVLIDIGYVPASPEYVRRVRELTAELGILLLFDELLTGFRVAGGGARELYGVRPDLTAYGKALANGYPIAALESTWELFAALDPSSGGAVGYVGTFNGHPVSMAATAESLHQLADGSVQRRLELLTERLGAGFAELGARLGIEVVLAGGGGHFQPYFVDGPVASYRDALRTRADQYAALSSTLLRRGVLISQSALGHSALSAAHTEADVDAILEAVEEAFTSIARDGAGGP